MYLRARYYSPLYGRFLSPDPVSPNGLGTTGCNGYAYATNNPVTLTDPSGMLPGFDGLSEVVDNVFAYLAYVLDCYLFGECRDLRRPERLAGEQVAAADVHAPGSDVCVAAIPASRDLGIPAAAG